MNRHLKTLNKKKQIKKRNIRRNNIRLANLNNTKKVKIVKTSKRKTIPDILNINKNIGMCLGNHLYLNDTVLKISKESLTEKTQDKVKEHAERFNSSLLTTLNKLTEEYKLTTMYVKENRTLENVDFEHIHNMVVRLSEIEDEMDNNFDIYVNNMESVEDDSKEYKEILDILTDLKQEKVKDEQ